MCNSHSIGFTWYPEAVVAAKVLIYPAFIDASHRLSTVIMTKTQRGWIGIFLCFLVKYQ